MLNPITVSFQKKYETSYRVEEQISTTDVTYLIFLSRVAIRDSFSETLCIFIKMWNDVCKKADWARAYTLEPRKSSRKSYRYLILSGRVCVLRRVLYGFPVFYTLRAISLSFITRVFSVFPRTFGVIRRKSSCQYMYYIESWLYSQLKI